MTKVVNKRCGCQARITDHGGGLETVDHVTRWCAKGRELVSQVGDVRGMRGRAADLADQITAHVLFA